jgi:Trk K+ transport system NAD-binding subunit
LSESFGSRLYFTEIIILPDSPLVDKTIWESGLGRDYDVTVLQMLRNESAYLVPRRNRRLRAGDILFVEGQRDEILKIKDAIGIDIKANYKLSDPDLPIEEIGLVEMIILPGSSLLRRTLKGARFRERYGLQVLGVYRRGETIRRKISQIPLRVGDILLVQGPQERIAALMEDHALHILGAVEENRLNVQRAPIAVLAMVGALAAATFEIV